MASQRSADHPSLTTLRLLFNSISSIVYISYEEGLVRSLSADCVLKPKIWRYKRMADVFQVHLEAAEKLE